jgi:hypothetical protein
MIVDDRATALLKTKRPFALKGFGFFELLPVMAMRIQQVATTVDDALVCKAMDVLLKCLA